MPVLSRGSLTIDYADEGQGPPVVLIHCSASTNRQWRPLTEALKDRYRVLAVNLFGYGQTTPWPGTSPQPLSAQAGLVLAVSEAAGAPVQLVGHSFGSSVALKAALLLGPRAASLVLLEPSSFSLLRQTGRSQAYSEVRDLSAHVKGFGASGDWPRVAERFVDYWLGDGSWGVMPEKRRAAFVESLPPNFYEWDTMDEEITIEEVKALTARTLVVSDAATRRPVRELVELFTGACPHWTFRTVPDGGHMAPITRPDLVNPIVCEFLDAGRA
jgi:pimeloyl-ACP methyl ester carboxylesterase